MQRFYIFSYVLVNRLKGIRREGDITITNTYDLKAAYASFHRELEKDEKEGFYLVSNYVSDSYH